MPWQKQRRNRFRVYAYLASLVLSSNILKTCRKLLSALFPEIGGIQMPSHLCASLFLSRSKSLQRLLMLKAPSLSVPTILQVQQESVSCGSSTVIDTLSRICCEGGLCRKELITMISCFYIVMSELYVLMIRYSIFLYFIRSHLYTLNLVSCIAIILILCCMSDPETETNFEHGASHSQTIKSPLQLQSKSKDQHIYLTSPKEDSSTRSGLPPRKVQTGSRAQDQNIEHYHEWKKQQTDCREKISKKVYRKVQNIHQKQEQSANYDPNLQRKQQIIKAQAVGDKKKGGYYSKKQTKGPVLYPCSFCNKEMTLEEMDKHHKQCQMAFQCDLCNDYFPLALIEDHAKCCKMRKGKNFKSINDREKIPEHKQPSWRRPIMQAFKAKHQEKNLANMGFGRRSWEDLEEQNRIYEKMQLQQFGIKLDEDQSYQSSKQPHRQFNYHNYRQPSEDDDSQEYEHEYRQFPPKAKSPAQGLTDKEIKRFPIDKYKKSLATEVECGICIKQQEEGDSVIRLPCFHIFHSGCLVPWLQMKSVCPKCKHNLKLK